MESIRRQVARARWRLNLQIFLRLVPWTLFACLLIAAVALAIPKVRYLPVDQVVWGWSWFGGALGVGLLAALIGVWLQRRNALDAAIELDRRCALKERVSSALALPADAAQTDVGQALVDDAERRVAGIEVREAFALKFGWPTLLPLACAVAAALVVLLPQATPDRAQASTSGLETRQQIKRSTQELSKKLAKRAERAEEAGLKDAEALFKQLREGLDELSRRDDVDQKRALIKLNDLAKEIEKRRSELGGADQLQRQLERLKDLERGPADKIAQALQQGDPQQAMQELKKLMEELKAGKLTEEQKQQLAKQLQDVQRKMQELADAHRQAKEDLQRQIQQKLAEGDNEAAGKLQRQLDQLQSQDQAMDRMQQLADQFAQASEAMKEGDMNKAAGELNELASQLEEMQTELDQMEQFNEMMDEIASCKDAMTCQHCNGTGCAECQGSQMGSMAKGGEGQGDGLGEGQGYGDRPETPTETGAYETRVRAKPKAGEAVRIGDARGPNQPGLTQQQVKEEITSALREEAEPISEQRLPKSQQDHVRQYYERRRKGE